MIDSFLVQPLRSIQLKVCIVWIQSLSHQLWMVQMIHFVELLARPSVESFAKSECEN